MDYTHYRNLIIGLGLYPLLLILAICFGGCAFGPTATVQHPPQEAIVQSPHSQDVTFTRAYNCFAKHRGWAITMSDPPRSFNGLVNNAAHITTLVEPDGKGARATIHGAVLQNKVTTGDFTEVQDYAQCLRAAL